MPLTLRWFEDRMRGGRDGVIPERQISRALDEARKVAKGNPNGKIPQFLALQAFGSLTACGWSDSCGNGPGRKAVRAVRLQHRAKREQRKLGRERYRGIPDGYLRDRDSLRRRRATEW